MTRKLILLSSIFPTPRMATPCAIKRWRIKFSREIQQRLSFLSEVGFAVFDPRPARRHAFRRRGAAHPARRHSSAPTCAASVTFSTNRPSVFIRATTPCC